MLVVGDGWGIFVGQAKDGVRWQPDRVESFHDIARGRDTEVLRLELDLDVVVECGLDAVCF